MPCGGQRWRVSRWGVVRSAVRLATLALLAAVGTAMAIGSTPFASVLDGLLARFHAVEVPCGPSVVPPVACFVVEPGHVAVMAESLEAFLEEHAGGVQRGAWISGNGTHHVLLTLADPAWGALELWLTELPFHRVEGRVEHLPKRRW